MAPSNNPDIDLRPMQQNGAYVHRPRAEEGSQRRSFGESQASTDAARVSNENHDGQDPGRGVDYQRAETSSSLGWELRRGLKSQHIFMISISTCIGMDFYVSTGAILSLGGPGAVMYSFGFLGILSYIVLIGISTMVRIWPVSGALFIYVKHFVGEEIGKIVGVLYWLTYTLSFSALASTVVNLFSYFPLPPGGKVGVILASIIVPLLVNLVKVEYFRRAELALGTFKIAVVLTTVIGCSWVNTQLAPDDQMTPGPSELFAQQQQLTAGWFGAITTSIYLASFSFVGIEVIAATAQEADIHKQPSRTASDDSSRSRSNRAVNPFANAAKLVPFFITILYTWGGWVASFNASAADLEYFRYGNPKPNENNINTIFVLTARHTTPRLAAALTVLLALSILSTSCAALYVASRTFYALASDMGARNNQSRSTLKRILVYTLPQKKSWPGCIFSGVPITAVLVSTLSLCWVPFTMLADSENYGHYVGIIVEAGTASCIIVWGFQNVAAYRLYKCYKKFTPNLDDLDEPDREADGNQEPPHYLPIRNTSWSSVRRAAALFAATVCFLIVTVCAAMALVEDLKFEGHRPSHGIGSLSVVGLFFILLIGWKAIQRDVTIFNDLSNLSDAQGRFRILNRLRD